MTFEQWQVDEPRTFELFLQTSEGDVEKLRRSFEAGQKLHAIWRAEWQALQDLCGPQPFITRAMAQHESVGPWHRALALAVGRAAPSKGKLK